MSAKPFARKNTKDPADGETAPLVWSDRVHAALPAERLGPKAKQLLARRRRLQGTPTSVVTQHGGEDYTWRKQGVTIAIWPEGDGLYVERSQELTGTFLLQSIVLSAAEFAIWSENEPLRHSGAFLYQQLCRRAQEILTHGHERAAAHPTAPQGMDEAAALDQIGRIRADLNPGATVRRLRRAAALLEADAATFTSFVREDEALGSYRTLLACDPQWGLTYLANRFCAKDPAVRYALSNTMVRCSDELPPLREDEQLVVDSAARHGFASMLIAPAPTAAGPSRVGVLCLGSRQPGHFKGASFTQTRVLARELAMQLNDWMHELVLAELITRCEITEDDRALLRHQQQGHVSKKISDSMGIKVKTVDCRFSRLCRRLGAPNRRAALRLAEIYGVI